jgi:hypothetical protein
MKKDIENYNDKGQLHGYQVRYGKPTSWLMVRGNSKNNFDIGYQEYHCHNKTEYYIR